MEILSGQTLLIDGAIQNPEITLTFDKEKTIRFLLSKLIKAIDMNKLSRIHCYRVSDQADRNGISGTVIIKESHISLHVWPDHRYFHLEISSCKPFNELCVLELLDKHIKEWMLLRSEVVRWGEVPTIGRQHRLDNKLSL